MESIIVILILAIMSVLWNHYMNNYINSIKNKDLQEINTSSSENDELNFSEAVNNIIVSNKSQIKIGK